MDFRALVLSNGLGISYEEALAACEEHDTEVEFENEAERQKEAERERDAAIYDEYLDEMQKKKDAERARIFKQHEFRKEGLTI